MVPRQLPDQIDIKRLGKPGVSHGRSQAARIKRICRLQALTQMAPKSQDRNAISRAQSGLFRFPESFPVLAIRRPSLCRADTGTR